MGARSHREKTGPWKQRNELGLWHHRVWVQIPALLLTCCVALEKLLTLSEPFPQHVKSGDGSTSFAELFRGWVRTCQPSVEHGPCRPQLQAPALGVLPHQIWRLGLGGLYFQHSCLCVLAAHTDPGQPSRPGPLWELHGSLLRSLGAWFWAESPEVWALAADNFRLEPRVWEQGRAGSEPGSRPSPDPGSAGALSLDFQSPELWEISFPCL